MTDREHNERMEAAVRIACGTADLHLMCSYPHCKCKAFPLGIKTAMEFWEKEKEASERFFVSQTKGVRTNT